ncbi:MAG: 30S ribosomal protein S6 [Moheibacter sp.]
MTHYETVFILTPVLSDAQVEEAVKKVEDFLKEEKAEIVIKENWGLKKLAYPIQNKRNGFYHLIEFKSDNQELISNLELMFKRDERVLRYLTVKLDKHGIAWAEKRRTKLKTEKSNA